MLDTSTGTIFFSLKDVSVFASRFKSQARFLAIRAPLFDRLAAWLGPHPSIRPHPHSSPRRPTDGLVSFRSKSMKSVYAGPVLVGDGGSNRNRLVRIFVFRRKLLIALMRLIITGELFCYSTLTLLRWCLPCLTLPYVARGVRFDYPFHFLVGV